MKTLAEGTATGDFGEDFKGFAFQEEITGVPNSKELYRVRVSITLERPGSVSDLTTTGFLYGALSGNR